MSCVLVIEDDDLLREGLVASFELAGFAANGVADGKRALEQIEGSAPDLIVCDQILPSMDGLSLLHSVREAPSLAEVPFFVISVQQSRSFEKTCQLAGANGFYAKPFVVTDLLMSARRLLL